MNRDKLNYILDKGTNSRGNNMDYTKMSEKLIETLELKGKPVAISLLKREMDIPEGLQKIENPRRYCQMLQDARFNDTVTFATMDEHACKGGAAAIGLQDYPDKIKSGELYFEKLGKELKIL